MSFKAKAGALKDYRIYGNTAGGEAVGDLETAGEHAGEYKVPVTVEGKNLFDKSKTANILNCYLSLSILVSNVDTRTIFIECKPSTTYTVSKIRGKRFVVGWSDKLPAPGVELQEKVINYDASSITITTGLDAKYLVAYIYNAGQDAPITADEMIASVQIEKGSTVTTYEPYHVPVTTPVYLPEQIKMVGDEAEYIDYGEQKQHRVRKNLLLNTAASQTIDGVTFTVNSDRSVTCNGTANNVVLYEIYSFPRFSGECILSGCPMTGSQNTYRLQYTNLRNLSYKDYGTGVNIYQFDEIQYPTSKINIRIEKGYTCNNLTFYPMIRKADIEDDTYEPYITNTELDVTLPALPVLPGTNTLTVGTEVQPSGVEITGRIKKGE